MMHKTKLNATKEGKRLEKPAPYEVESTFTSSKDKHGKGTVMRTVKKKKEVKPDSVNPVV